MLKDIKIHPAKDSHMYFSQCEYRIWHICYWQCLLNEFKQIELTNQYISVKFLRVRCINVCDFRCYATLSSAGYPKLSGMFCRYFIKSIHLLFTSIVSGDSLHNRKKWQQFREK